MDNCPICNHKILQHVRKVLCIVCSKHFHMKCISIDPDYINEIEKTRKTWHCCDCLTSILPFNCIDDDNEFFLSINDLVTTSHIQYLSDILFSPFELNDYDHQFDTFDADPDLNYFNSFNQYITNCNYFLESAFINEMSKLYQMKQNFSLCHLNIRSMSKNLKSFENYLDLIGHRFTILAFTETWLKDDCDLFSIPCYYMLENHRPNHLGGGVAICLRNDVQFIPRHDLAVFDDHMESVFAEISKDVLGTKKMSSLELFTENRIVI